MPSSRDRGDIVSGGGKSLLSFGPVELQPLKLKPKPLKFRKRNWRKARYMYMKHLLNKPNPLKEVADTLRDLSEEVRAAMVGW